MLTQYMDAVVEQTPALSLQRTLDTQCCIVNRWNEQHDIPIGADAVRLFLCDERRGLLTDEQRIFAKSCKVEVHAAYRRAVFRLLLMEEMLCAKSVNSPAEFFHLFASQSRSA